MNIEEIEIKTIEDVIENDVFNKLKDLPLVINGILIIKIGHYDGGHRYQHKIKGGEYLTCVLTDEDKDNINEGLFSVINRFRSELYTDIWNIEYKMLLGKGVDKVDAGKSAHTLANKTMNERINYIKKEVK